MKFYYGDITIEVPGKLYCPREDSLLMANALEKQELEGKEVLEIGCGSGLLAILAAKKGAIVTASDINTEAVKAASANAAANNVKIKFVESDLFQNLSGKYGLIFFNPPYLPDECSDLTYSGGSTGRDVAGRFISSSRPFLNHDGKILLLISSLTGEAEVLDIFKRNGFSAGVVARKKIPWEELAVIEAVKQHITQPMQQA